ncbi:hypothetical protein ACQP2Y_12470 [Actinoplanes sp. CA-051413]|uniref:hypothetical protein n=1 Tax=Actinoplanes sp. CA-051413 TaxID=3239899 RepID=UPI003D982972
MNDSHLSDSRLLTSRVDDDRMADEALLEELLNKILMTDQEIRDGAQAAEVSLEELGAAVRPRFSEARASCVQEQNLLADLQKQHSAGLEAIQLMGEHPYVRVARALASVALAVVASGAIFTWIMWGLLHNREWGVLWTRSPQVSTWLGIASGLVAVSVLALVPWSVNRRQRAALDGSDLRLLVARLDAARTGWETALRDRGLKGILREEINIRLPRYETVLQVRRADGLAEMHNPLHVVPSTAQVEVEQLIRSMPGGSIGISGPRGAGKTTLLQHFCSPEFAARNDASTSAVRVLLSAPVRYDPREFVLHLFASVCQDIVGPADPWRLDQSRGGHAGEYRRQLIFRTLTVAVILCAAWGMCLIVAALGGWRPDPNLQPGLFLVLAAGATLYLASEWQRSSAAAFAQPTALTTNADTLTTSARTLLTGLAFQQSIGQGLSTGVKLPAGIEFGISSSTTMTEKPMGLPEIVSRFREFLRQVSGSRQVCMGIDELDKFDSSTDIYEFLNDIKNIFGIPGCYYLISISENAMSAFERRGLPLRDAFDSAFDAVIDVPCLDFPQSRRLLRRRVIGLPEQFVALAHAMSGGLPRDLIRVTRDLVALSQTVDKPGDLATISSVLTGNDVRRKVAAARLAAQNTGLDAAVAAFVARLPSEASEGRQMHDSTLRLFDALAEVPTSTAPDADLRHRSEFAQIVSETAAYLYFCSTVREFFERFSLASRTDPAAIPKATPDVDDLAECRRSFTAGPRLAWASISQFRSRRQLDIWELPLG